MTKKTPPEPERRYPITVQLTAREIDALVGRGNQRPVAICVTSIDDDTHRVGYAEAALRAVQQAVLTQRHR
jgi:hypothetical protein